MTYRDEHEALRARLEATEQRLRETEAELADAKRLLDEGAALEPSTAPPPSRRVGHPPPAPPEMGIARSLVGLGGAVLGLFGIAFLLWNLPAADSLLDVFWILTFALLVFLVPAGLLVYLTMPRPSRRRQAELADAVPGPALLTDHPAFRARVADVGAAERARLEEAAELEHEAEVDRATAELRATRTPDP